MSLVDLLYRNISLYAHKTGHYPNRLVLGRDKYIDLEKEMRKRMAIGLTTYPDGTHRKLWGVPITIDMDNTNIIELGYMEQVEVGGE